MKNKTQMKFDFSDPKRVILVLIAVTLMGLSLSVLYNTNLGGDPFTHMNKGIISILPISLGNWQAILNVILLLLVIFLDRSQLGIGTIANMFLVGYSYDLFAWLQEYIWGKNFIQGWPMRIGIAVPFLILFVFSAALYMCCGLGASPFDALVFITHRKVCKVRNKEVPFRIIRMCYDFGACAIGTLFYFIDGNTYIGPVTIMCALFLGPVINWMGGAVNKILK